MKSGKHVFIEKPLCLNLEELAKIKANYISSQVLMVGFNRRFAPQIKTMKSLVTKVSGPKSMIITVNAGSIPQDHWVHNLEIGGGRIIGEACHFIDLLRFVIGVPIISYDKIIMETPTRDTVSIQLGFTDGSIGIINYFANGSRSFPKERVELFASGRMLQLDNYRRLRGFDWPHFKNMNLWRQDKGHIACAHAFIDSIIDGKTSPIPFDEILEVSKISIELA